MPGGDRTGPLGQGPGTGRTFGYCYGFDTPGYTKGPGRGMGRGFGYERAMGRNTERGVSFGYCRGRGFGTQYQGYIPGHQGISPMSKEDEIKLLKSEADVLKRSQKEIEKRLGELEKEE